MLIKQVIWTARPSAPGLAPFVLYFLAVAFSLALTPSPPCSPHPTPVWWWFFSFQCFAWGINIFVVRRASASSWKTTYKAKEANKHPEKDTEKPCPSVSPQGHWELSCCFLGFHVEVGLAGWEALSRKQWAWIPPLTFLGLLSSKGSKVEASPTPQFVGALRPHGHHWQRKPGGGRRSQVTWSLSQLWGQLCSENVIPFPWASVAPYLKGKDLDLVISLCPSMSNDLKCWGDADRWQRLAIHLF